MTGCWPFSQHPRLRQDGYYSTDSALVEGEYSQSPEESFPRQEQATLSTAQSMGPVCARKQPGRKRKKKRTGGEGEMGKGKGKERGGEEEREKARRVLLSLHLFLGVIPETEDASLR